MKDDGKYYLVKVKLIAISYNLTLYIIRMSRDGILYPSYPRVGSSCIHMHSTTFIYIP